MLLPGVCSLRRILPPKPRDFAEYVLHKDCHRAFQAVCRAALSIRFALRRKPTSDSLPTYWRAFHNRGQGDESDWLTQRSVLPLPPLWVGAAAARPPPGLLQLDDRRVLTFRGWDVFHLCRLARLRSQMLSPLCPIASGTREGASSVIRINIPGAANSHLASVTAPGFMPCGQKVRRQPVSVHCQHCKRITPSIIKTQYLKCISPARLVTCRARPVCKGYNQKHAEIGPDAGSG
jgi:hypothetical protein